MLNPFICTLLRISHGTVVDPTYIYTLVTGDTLRWALLVTADRQWSPPAPS